MDETKFYFARLNFKHQLTSFQDFTEGGEFDRVERVKSLILEYGNSSEPVYEEDEETKWRFGKVKEYEGVILGRFGKVYADQPMQYNDEEEDFERADEHEEMADVAHFAVYPETDIIAFNRKKRIGQNQFIDAFSIGYNSYYDIPDGLEIKLIKNNYEIEEILDRADRVFSVDFDLIPTNPIRDEEMRVLDEPMRQMGADDLNFSASSDTELEPDNEYIRAGFALSTNGYGDFEMGYEEEGEDKIYDSRDRPAIYSTEEPESTSDMISQVDELREEANRLIITED